MPLKSHLDSFFEFTRFVLRHAKKYEAQHLPKQFARMPYHECWKTAVLMAESGHGTYVTGIGVWQFNPLPHAWIIDGDGSVIDPTWDEPEKNEYYGVAIPIEMVREEVLKNRRWELLRIDGRNNTEFMERWDKSNQPNVTALRPHLSR